MKVIDVRSFNIPSDENDYDELVEFADTMASISPFDAVPVEVLDKIKAEIKQLPITDTAINLVETVIDKYKVESEG